jgi:hypothetical protein
MNKIKFKVGDLVRSLLPPDKVLARADEPWLGMVIYPPVNDRVCVATVAGELSFLYKKSGDKQKRLFSTPTFHLDVVASGQEG